MNIIEITHIQDLKNGQWFKLKPEAKKVYEGVKNTVVWLDFEY